MIISMKCIEKKINQKPQKRINSWIVHADDKHKIFSYKCLEPEV